MEQDVPDPARDRGPRVGAQITMAGYADNERKPHVDFILGNGPHRRSITPDAGGTAWRGPGNQAILRIDGRCFSLHNSPRTSTDARRFPPYIRSTGIWQEFSQNDNIGIRWPTTFSSAIRPRTRSMPTRYAPDSNPRASAAG